MTKKLLRVLFITSPTTAATADHYLNDMIPIWEDDRRRKINLGGASSASSHAAILDQAKAHRLEREDHRRKQINAVRLQAWWRGVTEARSVRKQMKQAFADDVTGINGLRCLVLIGMDEDVLGQWSSIMLASGQGELFQCIHLIQNMNPIYMQIYCFDQWLNVIKPVGSCLCDKPAYCSCDPSPTRHSEFLCLRLCSLLSLTLSQISSCGITSQSAHHAAVKRGG